MFSNNFVKNWLKYDLIDLFLLYIVYMVGKIYTFFQNCYKNVDKEAFADSWEALQAKWKKLPKIFL